MEYSSGKQCYHCGKPRLAKSCPHCGHHEIVDGELTVCQRCGGVFKLGRCFQCAWSGEPFADTKRAKRQEKPYVLGMFELEKMVQRLARKAALLGLAAGANEAVSDAVNHAFVDSNEAPIEEREWIPYFESAATAYLDGVAKDEGERGFGVPKRERFSVKLTRVQA